MRLFMARGYRAVTMELVAEAAGVTKPAVYYHFKDKGSLLVAVAGLVFSRAQSATETVLAKATPLADRLREIAVIVLSLPQPFTAFDAMMHEAQGELAAEQMLEIHKAQRSVFQVIETTLVDAAARGEIRTDDPVLVAHAFLALLRVGQTRDERGERRFPDVTGTAGRLVAALWEGIEPRT